MKIAIVCNGDAGISVFSGLLTVARKIGSHIDFLITGSEEDTQQISCLLDVKRVIHFQGPPLAEALAPAIVEELHRSAYECILAPSNTFGKNLLPRVAALLDVMQVSDVTRIIGPDTFERPIYAGNALESIRCHEPVKVMTIRTSSFSGSEAPHQSPCPIEKQTLSSPSYAPQIVAFEKNTSQRPDLLQARVVVSGGRGFQKKEDFLLLDPLADCLGASIGATRAVVDAGFISNDHQVGQTGKVVVPDFYFAIGISGAIQHLSGMKESKIIIAINNDPDAPIFQVTDYGLVADLYEAVPELTTILKENKT